MWRQQTSNAARAPQCRKLFPIEAQVGAYLTRTGEREGIMEHLYFVCPKTGRDIDAGIETDLETLLRIKTQTIEIECPICRERHEWRVADARLTTLA
jgi:hypothetical protein